MGTNYIMVNIEHKKYLHLPKKTEWCNELWMIWEFIGNFDRIDIISANDDQYDKILNSVDWGHFEDVHPKFKDVTGLLTIANQLSCGASNALYHATSRQRQEDRNEMGNKGASSFLTELPYSDFVHVCEFLNIKPER